MKKITAIFLLVLMLLSTLSIASFAASDAYKATWSLKASVLNASSSSQAADKNNYLNAPNKTVYTSDDSVIPVYPGQVVWVTMHLKTGSSYYAGSLSAHFFYDNNIFTSTNQSGNCYIWDKSGNYSSICKGYGAPFSKMVDSFKKKNYPDSWSQSKKDSIEFYSVIMYPNVSITTEAVAKVNSDLVTVPVYVKQNAKIGSTGTIFMTKDDMRTPENQTGYFFLGLYKNKDLLGSEKTYDSKISFDVSAAKLNFVVCSKNAKGISISQKELKMNYKSTQTLTAEVKGVSGAKAIWSSSDPKIAAVDQNGKVTAKGKGTATITASYGGFSADCKVTVDYTFGQWLIKILLFGWIWY